MKTKICEACGKECYLWKAHPPTCKSCAMKNATLIGSYKILTKTDTPQPKKKRNKRINPISEKEKKRLAEYRIVRDEYMEKHKYCEFKGCNNLSNDLHHKASRKYHLCNVKIFMAVCRFHHEYIHNNCEESYNNGYLIKSI